MGTLSSANRAEGKVILKWQSSKVILNATAAAGSANCSGKVWNEPSRSTGCRLTVNACYSSDNSMLLRTQLQLQSVAIQCKIVFKPTVTAQCARLKVQWSEVKWSKAGACTGCTQSGTVPLWWAVNRCCDAWGAHRGFQTPQMKQVLVFAAVGPQIACAGSWSNCTSQPRTPHKLPCGIAGGTQGCFFAEKTSQRRSG